MKFEKLNVNESTKKVLIKSLIGIVISLIVFPILAIIGFCSIPGKIIGFIIFFGITSYCLYELCSILPLPKWVKYYFPLISVLFFFYAFHSTKTWLTTENTSNLNFYIKEQYIFKLGVEGIGYLITFVFTLIPFMFYKKWNKKTFILIAILYIGTLFISIVGKNLVYLNSGNFWLMIIIMGTVISTDTFAYFGGKLFHNKIFKQKLAPKISPNKSIEGAIIGYFFGFIVAFSCLYFLNKSLYSNLPFLRDSYKNRQIVIPIIALSMPIVSIAGDLLFSGVKRFSHVKDFSSLIPEHGGMLDRIDAFVVVSFFYMLLFV